MTDRLTAAQINAWQALVDHVAGLLGLDHWTICVHADPPHDPHADATTSTVYGRKYAWINVRPEVHGLPRPELRRIVVHELLHVATSELREWAENDLAAAVPNRATYRAIGAGFTRADEHWTDAVATALGPHLPIPAALLAAVQTA